MTHCKVFITCLTVLLLLSVLPQTTFGQRKQVTIDSLTRLLGDNSLKPAKRVDVLNSLGSLYAGNDSAKTFKYALEARKLAEGLKYEAAIAKSYQSIGLTESYKSHQKEAAANFAKAEVLFSRLKMENELGVVYNDEGVALQMVNQFEASLVPLQKAELIHRRTKNHEGLADDLRNLGIAYRRTSQFSKAIECYDEAIKLSEKSPQNSALSGTYINLAELLTLEKNYKQAEYYYLTAIKILSNNGDQLNLGIAHVNLAQTYIYQSKYEEGKDMINKGIIIFTKIDFKRGLQVCYNTLGAINIRQQMYAAAIAPLQKSLDISNQSKTYSGMALPLSNMGMVMTNLNRLKEARFYLDSAERAAVKYKNDRGVFGEIYNRRSALDSALKDYRGALLNRNRYLLIKDSTLNVSLSKQINELQIKYQTEKKENQIALLDKDNANKTLLLQNQELEIGKGKSKITEQQQTLVINELELKNKNQKIINQQLDVSNKEASITSLKKESHIQKLELSNRTLQLRQRNILIIAFAVVILIGGIAAYAFYKRNQFKQEAKLQAEIHKQQEVATRSLFEGEQNERIRIARDLHDSIGQMLSVIKMNVSNIQHDQPENKITGATLDLVDNTITEVRNISHNLIPEELNFGLFNAIEDMCDKINMSNSTQVSINLPDDVKEHVFEKTNELSIYRIVQEVLNNMVKHSQASQIGIDVIQQEMNLVIAIQDNGKGFDTTQINKSKGIGWKNIAARVNMLDGKMQIRSEQLTGTQIEITIPGA